MCFSATASFASSVVIGSIGVATLKKVKKKREFLFAGLPIVFALHQFIEGFVWISFGSEFFHLVVVRAFSFMAFAFWPMFMPLSVYLIEGHQKSIRKTILLALIIAGVAFGLFNAYMVFFKQVTSGIVCGSIDYRIPGYPEIMVTPAQIIYPVIILLSLWASRFRFINIFGVLTLLSFLVTMIFYYKVYFSVWCFFTALLSLFIYTFFRNRKKLSGELDPRWPSF